MYTHAQDTLDQWFFQQLASLTAPADASAVIWLLLAQQHTRHGERDQNLDQWQAPVAATGLSESHQKISRMPIQFKKSSLSKSGGEKNHVITN